MDVQRQAKNCISSLSFFLGLRLLKNLYTEREHFQQKVLFSNQVKITLKIRCSLELVEMEYAMEA